jgi:hypothetical protein
MERTRAKDWLIGAIGMILLLAVAVAILWWVVSEPADGGAADSVPPPPVGTERVPGGREPPTDLRDSEVWLADLRLQAGTVVTADARLRDVRAVGTHVVTGQDGLVAARVTVGATVPFEVVAEELGGDSEVSAAEGGQVTVVRSVEALGREWRVVATGTVEAQDGRVVVEPRAIDFGGPEFLSGAVAAVVRGLVTIEHDITGLPDGLVLRDVAVQDDGFRARLRGRDVELVP